MQLEIHNSDQTYLIQIAKHADNDIFQLIRLCFVLIIRKRNIRRRMDTKDKRVSFEDFEVCKCKFP